MNDPQLQGNIAERSLVIAVFYRGPWERVAARLHALDRDSDEIRREVRPGSRRDRVAMWCWRRDDRWRRRHALAGLEPMW